MLEDYGVIHYNSDMLRNKILAAVLFFSLLTAIFLPKHVLAAEVVPTMYSYNTALANYLNSNKLTSYSNVQSALAQFSIGIFNMSAGAVNPNNTSQVLVPGAVSGVGNAIAFLIEQKPVATETYVADLFQHAPLTKSAYAQGVGVGFSSLTPILGIWKAFRDLTYVIFVLIFVVIGFMIMFRQKLSSGVVVTVESALPNLIVTLLLITFSYAIAGLLIDALYLVMYLVAQVFSDLITIPGKSTLNIALTDDIFHSGFDLVFRGGANGNASVVGSAATAISEITKGFFENMQISGWLSDLGGNLLGILGAVVFALAIFFAIIRTFFKLLEAYVGFMLGVIFAPFQLLGGAISGKSTFGEWMNGLIANLAAFPVVVVLIFLALALGGSGNASKNIGFQMSDAGNLEGGFTPPLVTMRTSGTGRIGYAFQAIVAMGILMLMPEALKMTKDAFHAKSAFDAYVPAISKGLQAGVKGETLVPGLKFTQMPGAEKIIPSALRVGGRGIAGAAIGGIGTAAAVGTYAGSKVYQASEDNGGDKNVSRIAGISAGAGLAASTIVPGAIVGGVAGAIGPKRIISMAGKAQDAMSGGALKKYEKPVEKGMDILRSIQANRRAQNLRKAQSPDGNQQGGVMP